MHEAQDLHRLSPNSVEDHISPNRETAFTLSDLRSQRAAFGKIAQRQCRCYQPADMALRCRGIVAGDPVENAVEIAIRLPSDRDAHHATDLAFSRANPRLTT